MTIKSFNKTSQIIDNYDAFLIDLWGVIHDGLVIYPGVNDCLKQIKAAGKKVIFLSNAPRRASKAAEGLKRVGVEDGLYDHIITSGEVAFEYASTYPTNLGKNFYMIGPDRDNGLFDGLEYQSTPPEKADFVVVTGFENDESTLAEKLPELQECLKHNLPLICVNPDMVVVRQTGARALCAGVIAQEYKKMGGKISQFGKPHKSVYEKCFSLLDGIDKSRIAAIGDNLDTDIKGAVNEGIDSYLIAGGILAENLGINHGQLPEIDKLQKLCDNANSTPFAVLPEFIW